MIKTVTNQINNNLMFKIDCNFSDLYYKIAKEMPLGAKWITNTGKTKRLYFWFYGNIYQGNQLC